jgi:CBS domain containing-hemolysin-like protein
MTILLVVVFLTLFISAQCSLYEATLYSIRLGALEASKSEEKKKGLALKMIKMKKNIAAPISAILILNTIANTAGATLAGMYADKVMGTSLVPFFSIGFTLAILFLSEITPKTLGAVHWRFFWPYIVWPLTVMKYGLYPFIIITQKFTNILTRGRPVARLSEEEILGMVRVGAKEGEITQWESRLVHNIIQLEDKTVREIMTPRTVMFALNVTTTIKEAAQALRDKGFTRIPVYKDDRENIIGYVMRHELDSLTNLNQHETKIDDIIREISFVPETTNCLNLLMNFLKKRKHMAIVEDEYRGVAGLVTLEDLLETALGTEIVDETDQVVDLQQAARKRKQKSSFSE